MRGEEAGGGGEGGEGGLVEGRPRSGFRSGGHTTTSAQTSSGTPLIPNSTVVGFAIKVVRGISI